MPGPAQISRFIETASATLISSLRRLHYDRHGVYATDYDVVKDYLFQKEPAFMAFAENNINKAQSVTELVKSQAPKQEARSGIDITGKKMRIVFGKGRDLNIFNVQTMNVDGQWWRITDGDGHLYVIDPKKVNYTETK